MSANKGIWVYSDNYDLALEMLGKGRELADMLQAELTAITSAIPNIPDCMKFQAK